MSNPVFTPVTPADGTFSGAGAAAWAAGMTGSVTDASLTLSDVTTNDVSASAHGFAPKVTNAANFLKGDGTWANPSAGAVSWTRVTKTNAATPYTIPSSFTIVMADTSAGVLTVNLPTTPADGDVVAVKRITTDSNALTIGRNGKNIEGTVADVTAVSGVLACYEFQYDSNAGSWWII